MLDHQLRFAPIDETAAGAPETGEMAENPSDEFDIIANQDETDNGSPQRGDRKMGGMGSSNIGLDNARFARGEADLVEQMSRTTQRMDQATGRTDDPFEGFDTETPADDDEVGH